MTTATDNKITIDGLIVLENVAGRAMSHLNSDWETDARVDGPECSLCVPIYPNPATYCRPTGDGAGLELICRSCKEYEDAQGLAQRARACQLADDIEMLPIVLPCGDCGEPYSLQLGINQSVCAGCVEAMDGEEREMRGLEGVDLTLRTCVGCSGLYLRMEYAQRVLCELCVTALEEADLREDDTQVAGGLLDVVHIHNQAVGDELDRLREPNPAPTGMRVPSELIADPVGDPDETLLLWDEERFWDDLLYQTEDGNDTQYPRWMAYCEACELLPECDECIREEWETAVTARAEWRAEANRRGNRVWKTTRAWLLDRSDPSSRHEMAESLDESIHSPAYQQWGETVEAVRPHLLELVSQIDPHAARLLAA